MLGAARPRTRAARKATGRREWIVMTNAYRKIEATPPRSSHGVGHGGPATLVGVFSRGEPTVRVASSTVWRTRHGCACQPAFTARRVSPADFSEINSSLGAATPLFARALFGRRSVPSFGAH